jgi:hypothetical protein
MSLINKQLSQPNQVGFELLANKKLAEFTTSKISELVILHYGLEGFTIEKAPRGFAGQTFFINTKSKNYVFKIIPKERVSDNLDKSLLSLFELANLGIDNVTIINPDKFNKLSIVLGDSVCMLFDRIDAKWVSPKDLNNEQYLKVLNSLIRIQSFTKDIKSLPVENFEFKKHIDIKNLLEKFESGIVLDEKTNLLKTEIQPHVNFIKNQISSFEKILSVVETESKKCQWVITHGDYPGNVLVKDQKIFIIDWDELMLAPKERDAILVWGKYLDYLMQNKEVNSAVFGFYTFQRFFDDMHDFIIEILRPDCDIQNAKKWIVEMLEECLNNDSWLIDLIQRYKLLNPHPIHPQPNSKKHHIYKHNSTSAW